MLHGGLNLKNVRWQELRRLLPGMAVGTLTGLWLMGKLDPKWPLFFLGLYIIVVAVRARKPGAGRGSVDPRSGHLSAWLIGVIEVMFATAAPMVVVWLQMRALDDLSLRASVPMIMVLARSVAVAVLFGFG